MIDPLSETLAHSSQQTKGPELKLVYVVYYQMRTSDFGNVDTICIMRYSQQNLLLFRICFWGSLVRARFL